MTMPEPVATARTRLAGAAGSTVELVPGGAALGASGCSPAPLELLVASLAADTAVAARGHLERDGDRADLEVVVTLDPGAPPLLYRRVQLSFRLGTGDARRLAEACERSEVTVMLRPAFTIRTAVEHEGEPLT